MTYSYDAHKRLTAIAVNGVSVYGYTLNVKNHGMASTLCNGDNWIYV